MSKKKQQKAIPKIHPRNRHTGRYDFEVLVAVDPELQHFVRPNIHGDDSIDFADATSVRALNKALLKLHYDITFWDLPDGYLCPPIPGRADYIHHMADWLCVHNFGNTPTGPKITCLDIGVGSSLIYPIIGTREYDWNFIGSDIDSVSLESSRTIINRNPRLIDKVTLRLQKDPKDILYGIITQEERVDFAICNPPFHTSAEEAQAGTNRKVSNLSGKKTKDASLNFEGQPNELWCEGGEKKFIREYIRQSKKFGNCCFWYSTLVSKQNNLKGIYAALEDAGAAVVHTIPMGQGNKTSRIVTWTFLTREQQKHWKNTRWKSTN
ncbi:MAG: 23S rRNA (adenine(1618)-N(6))-methyltransferase RlmF [Marinoscillum sp.]